MVLRVKSHCSEGPEREGEYGAGKPEDLPIVNKDGHAIIPSGSIRRIERGGIFFCSQATAF
jgi:hypothetical protein